MFPRTLAMTMNCWTWKLTNRLIRKTLLPSRRKSWSSRLWDQRILRRPKTLLSSLTKNAFSRTTTLSIKLFGTINAMVTSSSKSPKNTVIKQTTSNKRDKRTNNSSTSSTQKSTRSSPTKRMTKTMSHARSPSVTSSSTRSVPPKPPTYPFVREVWRLSHQRLQPSQSKLLNGWSSTLTCASTRTICALRLKKPPKVKERIRTKPKWFKSKLRTHSTPPRWSAASRLWREWLSKTLSLRSSPTTSTTRTTLMTRSLSPSVPSYLSGASPLRNPVVRNR